jgi:acyl carrier protein
MQATRDDIVETIRSFLARRKNFTADFDLDTPLYGDGLGLDSLDAAELSAVLEDTHGSDPFSAGDAPATVGDVVAFYG